MAARTHHSSDESDRNRIKKAFLERSSRALERMVESVTIENLAEALAAPTDIGGMAFLLSEIGALQPQCIELDPLSDLRARGAFMKHAMIREAGGAYSTSQVADLLGISRQAVQQRARRGTLLAFTLGNNDRYYPAIQFDEHGVVAGLEQVLNRFNVTDPWTKLSVLLDTDEFLGGRRVIDALRDGDLEKVLRVVESFAP